MANQSTLKLRHTKQSLPLVKLVEENPKRAYESEATDEITKVYDQMYPNTLYQDD